MDLAELRINRTPVTPNSKCEGCVHYDGNAQAKGGVCEVGQAPSMCGTGKEPRYGYAPLAELAPDEMDDLATPTINGTIGAMNEHGNIEQTIKMKRVCLGDEDLTFAQRVHGTLVDIAKKSIGYAQGEVNAFAGAEMAAQRYGTPGNTMVTVAKSTHDLHLSPRKQHKYGVSDVLAFLKSRGMPVTDDDVTVCKSRFGPTRKLDVVPTQGQAAQHLQQHNSVGPHAGAGTNPILPPSPRASLNSHPSDAAGWKPRNKTPTAPLPVSKSENFEMKTAPNVKLIKSDGMHDFKDGDAVMNQGRKGAMSGSKAPGGKAARLPKLQKAEPPHPGINKKGFGESKFEAPHGTYRLESMPSQHDLYYTPKNGGGREKLLGIHQTAGVARNAAAAHHDAITKKMKKSLELTVRKLESADPF